MPTSPNGGGGREERFTREAGFDWAGIEESPEFRELTARRRRFITRASIFFLAFFLTYLLLTAFAQDFMGTEIAGMPLAFLLAVAQVLMTWGVTWAYLRTCDREIEPLEERAASVATRRFVRSSETTGSPR
jgi:uncharacterized membrane protein (DUF485 family)